MEKGHFYNRSVVYCFASRWQSSTLSVNVRKFAGLFHTAVIMINTKAKKLRNFKTSCEIVKNASKSLNAIIQANTCTWDWSISHRYACEKEWLCAIRRDEGEKVGTSEVDISNNLTTGQALALKHGAIAWWLERTDQTSDIWGNVLWHTQNSVCDLFLQTQLCSCSSSS